MKVMQGAVEASLGVGSLPGPDGVHPGPEAPAGVATRWTAARIRAVALTGGRALGAMGIAFGGVHGFIANRLELPLPITALCWGLIVLVAFVGLGALVNRVLLPARRVDWGLRSAWGMGLALAVAGPLMLAHLAVEAFLTNLVVVGVALALDDAACRARRGLRRGLLRIWADPLFYSGVAFLFLIACLLIVGSHGFAADWKVADDPPAYQVFPKEIAQTGSLFQPFSLRRVSSLGGVSFLQAIIFVGSSIDSVHVFDRGLCALIAAGLVLGHVGSSARLPRALLLLPAMLVFLLPARRTNLASEMSGVVVILALFRTLTVLPAPAETGRRSWFLLALLAAGAVTLRPFYLVPTVGMVLASEALAVFRRDSSIRRAVIGSAWFLVGIAALLVPWMVLLWIDCGTPFFPMISGNLRPGSGFVGESSSGYYHLTQLWEGSSLPGAFTSTPLLALAGVCLSDRTGRCSLRAFYVSTLVGFLLLMAMLPRTPGFHLERYGLPIAVAFVLGIAIWALTEERPTRPRGAAAIVIVLCALCVDFSRLRSGAHDIYLPIVNSFRPMLRRHGLDPIPSPRGTDERHRQLQASIPRGAGLATMIDEPHRLNFGRNPIRVLDIPGLISPPPGFPFFEGSEAMADYLMSQSIRYLAFMKSEASKHLYNDSVWQAHMRPSRALLPHNREAKYVLDVMAVVRELGTTRRIVFEDDDVVAIDSKTLVRSRARTRALEP